MSNQQNNNHDDNLNLLPGLPDHISQLCLSKLSPSVLATVCGSWRRLIDTPSFPPYLALYAALSTADNSSITFQTYNPISGAWSPLPNPPFHALLRHPSFVSRSLPVQSLSVAGSLLLLAATTENLAPALPRPLLFDPAAAAWSHAPPLAAPRRWCAAGALQGAAYVASGVGGGFSHAVARSVERWGGGGAAAWEAVAELKDSSFSRDAVEAVGWRGRLCMAGGAHGGGVVFDLRRGVWAEMPPGMAAGWRGPAAALDEDELFAVDPTSGSLAKYVEERDSWEEVTRSDKLKGAEKIAAGGGKVCVVCDGGAGIAVVGVSASETGRIWEVDLPEGQHAMGLHILPRMIDD